MKLDVKTTKKLKELAEAKFAILPLLVALALASSCVGGGALEGDSNEPGDGGGMLDGEAGDAAGSDGRIVAIGGGDGDGDGLATDGGARQGDAGAPTGDGDGDGDGDGAPACNCAGRPVPTEDVDGRSLPYCTDDLGGLVEADGLVCDAAGACVAAVATRACGVECVPGIVALSMRDRCRN